MNTEDPQAMRALDTRLSRLHRNLDTSEGFEDRLAARIADTRRAHAAPLAAEALAGLERVHERERHAADRQARLEWAVIAVAGLGATLAVWRFAPLIAGLLESYANTVQVAPALFATSTLAAAGVTLWAVLRRMGFEPRSLLGA